MDDRRVFARGDFAEYYERWIAEVLRAGRDFNTDDVPFRGRWREDGD